MKLFYSPGACSLAPHIVLRESGAAFTLEKVDIPKHLTATGVDYYSITPKGQVPLLQLDDGSTLSEGPIITQYIADQAAATGLLPAAGSMARYRVMEWQNFITSELHKGFSPLFNPAFDAAAKGIQAGLLRKKFEWVDSKLDGTHYLTGDDFTVADAYLFTVSGWAKMVALDLSNLAHLQAFLTRVAARPAVQAALKAEGLIPA
ncbi:MAG: glutathione transferase GstA [Rhodoferax sp.]|uniref:glutathione transferase GstA n=1 Tax=Rhodoferax sp. TaxID=50421 RepID=UPI003266717B